MRRRSRGSLNEKIVSRELATFLASYRFAGDIFGYREGEVFTSLSPILRIEGRFCDLVLETLALSILNYDSGVATKAARVVSAAQGRRLIEMGSRRTNEAAAVAAARAAYVAGFDATSNLAAGRIYGVPTAGTAAHAFILAHRSEREAFEAQVRAQGPSTTLLVDTFDTEAGTELALDVAGPSLGAIRIDSGDLADSTRRSRELLDQRGATEVKITVTGDLDEFAIAELLDERRPGRRIRRRDETGHRLHAAGIRLQVGGHRRRSNDATRRQALDGQALDWRRQRRLPTLVDGVAVTELVVARDAGVAAPPENARPLSHILVDGGDIVVASSLEQARATRQGRDRASCPDRRSHSAPVSQPSRPTSSSSTRTNHR